MNWLSRITGKKSQINEEFEAELEGAFEGLQMATQAHMGTWNLGSEENWSVNQDEGKIVFSFSNGTTVKAPVQILGTYSSDDDSWVWGWANSSVRPELISVSQDVHRYGVSKQILELTEGRIKCDEMRAWKLAALGMKIGNLSGVYRGPANQSLFIFLAFGEVSLNREGIQ